MEGKEIKLLGFFNRFYNGFGRMGDRLSRFARAWGLLVSVCLCGVSVVSANEGFDVPAALVGEWRETGGGEVLKVLGGGKVILDFSGFSVKGEYEFIDFDRVRFESMFGSMVYSVQLADAKLRLIDDRNNARDYERQTEESPTLPCPTQKLQAR